MIKILPTPLWKIAIGIGGIVLLFASMLASTLFGLQNFTLSQAVDAYVNFHGSNEHLIIREARVPRAVIAACVGASLSIAGVLLQTITKNDLASPSLLGINSGAVLFIAAATLIPFYSFSFSELMWVGFVGAGVTTLFIYGISLSTKEGASPLKITLAGAAISTFATSATSLLMLVNQRTLEVILQWLVGSVEGRELEHLVQVFPYMFGACLGAWILSGKLNLFQLGEDVAKGLGVRIAFLKLLSILFIIVLAGSSVAIAGPIVFLGIIIPHICRYLVGTNHAWLIPYSGIFGALLLVIADWGARYPLMPQEVPVGITTAILGVPFIIYIARRGNHG